MVVASATYLEVVPASGDAMLGVRRLVDAASLDTCPVFLAGETGAGKGYFAERIHALSSRATGPFTHVFAGALSADAFDPASSFSTPIIGAARRGSLFLDEVEELSPAAQASLFHYLERQARAGTPDVRFLVATAREPEQIAASPRLRRDLFFRLAALMIALPPLRLRGIEVTTLAHTFAG